MPVLLLRGQALVKSVRFNNHKYIGDSLNAARIFNELDVDELIFLDIDATRNDRVISLDFVNAVAEEVTVPFSVGGGIKSVDDIRNIIKLGVEKVIIGARAAQDPPFIRRAADEFGSSTISVCVDVKRDFFRRNRVHVFGGRTATKYDPVEFAVLMENSGAGEVILQSIDRDGMMSGYDLDLISSVSERVGIPVVALGGAASESDLVAAVENGHASAVAAGSLFVYHSKQGGVLINYPLPGPFRSR